MCVHEAALMRGGIIMLTGLSLLLSACDRGPEHNIVPMPRSVSAASGYFTLDGRTAIALNDPTDERSRSVADTWAEPFRRGSGLPLPIAHDGTIRIGIDGTGEPESYRLEVTPVSITVLGADHPGLFYGLQTLTQLMPAGADAGSIDGSAGIEIAAVSIEDAPRFSYRGMHLDVARHFFGPDFVKHYIDMLARYKFNRFHWHLTEDQGWRIEIDAFPRLTEVSAYRDQTQIGHGSEEFNGDGQRHGGFYTKDEIRDIVAYAQERFVTVIPEIEMPGHSRAVLAAYPELACTEGPFEVATTWGVFEDIFCPYEATFEFLETVLAEVIELFPGPYIHVGGDEAPRTRWKESEYVQRLMQREGFTEETQVQSWFIRRIERFLNENGKRMIGWDEILEGGLAPDATVMSWRGTIGGIEAARMGHDVVMTPNSALYFDYYQAEDRDHEPPAIGGLLPLETVYGYEPVPEELGEADAVHIIGAQANVWTEYMKTPGDVEYMVFPRMFALSEVVWSPKDAKDYRGFIERLEWHFERLDALGVRYRPLDR